MLRSAAVEIVFVTSEITPYSRHGSLGDACAALPKALRGLGHRVTVVSPLYRGIDPAAHALARRLSTVAVEIDGQDAACVLFDGRTTGGVELMFVAHDGLVDPPWLEASSAARARAARLFGVAAARAIETREPAVEVVHVHGWFGSQALVEVERVVPRVGRVLSLHDAHARAAAEGTTAVLAAGVGAAERVVVRSQVEATELARDGVALGVAQALRSGVKLVGIADGLDAARWNPLTDASLPARFDPVRLEGKARCKAKLQLDRGLPVRAEVPLVAVLLDADGELAQTIARALRLALRNELQLLVVGTGASEPLAALAAEYPDRVAFDEGADEVVAHRALAGSDLALLPATPRREGGLGLAALRYGAVPVASRTGTLTDSLVDCDAKLETGTGFVLDGNDPETIAQVLTRAVAAHAVGERFTALQRKVMRLDVSWERSARRYEHLYRELRAVGA